MNTLQRLKIRSTDVVVAWYNEDLEWLMTPCKVGVLADYVILYCKGPNDPPEHIRKHCKRVIKLPNVGREGHTYLHHIIQNYDEGLASNTVFFQGSITDHKQFVSEIQSYIDNKQPYFGVMFSITKDELFKPIQHFGIWLEKIQDGRILKSQYKTPGEYIEQVWDLKLTKQGYPVTWAANFAVSKEQIKKLSKTVYEKAHDKLNAHNDPEDGHYQERSWAIIFNSI